MSEAAMNHLFDIIILGNTNTGKKTLRNTLANISPSESLSGNSSRISMTKRKYRLRNDATFGVRYWLSRGDYRTQANFIKTIENIHAVLILVDLSDRKSLLKLENYFTSFSRRNLPLFMIGNKLDLNRQITIKEMMTMALRHNAQYIEVSLKTGENVEEMRRSILMSGLKDCEVKGGCFNYLKKTREIQHQHKRAALFRYAMETACAKRYRMDILNQATKNHFIPNSMVKLAEIAADEREYDFYQTNQQKPTEIVVAQQTTASVQPQEQIQQTLVQESPATVIAQQTSQLDKNTATLNTNLFALSNNNLMNNLRSSVMQYIQYAPLQIEVIN